VTNGPAEAVNKIIKRVRHLCTGIDFETPRAKLIPGDFFVKRRPPHPLDPAPAPKNSTEARGKAQEAKHKKKPPGPNANTERLRRAREARDKTKGLPESPMKTPGYAERVGHLEQHGVSLNKVAAKTSAQGVPESYGERPVLNRKRRTDTTSTDSKQLKMF
jgi:hypothetical protein